MKVTRLIICAALLPALLLSGPAAPAQPGQNKEKEARPAPAAPATEQTAVGRFRVMLTGFIVNDQTEDNILETDGKGDEVYIVANVAQYDAYTQEYPDGPAAETTLGSNDPYHGAGNVTLSRTLVSDIMGDVNNQENPPRISAGSAGREGGLKTGNSFPRYAPWAVQGSVNEARPPMLLWEGVLRRGRDLVIIVPTIWEWDGGNPAMRRQYEREVVHYLLYATRTRENHVYTWSLLTGTDAFGAGDRPIGMLADSRFWFPKGVLLNYDVALRAAAAASPYTREPGSIELRYFGRGEDYTLYLKIERR